jgi:hypothetical protein
MRVYFPNVFADEGAIVFILACIEMNLGIICGSLPGCKPLLSRLFPRMFGSGNYSTMSRARCALPGARISLRFPQEDRVYLPPKRAQSTISMESVPVKLDTRNPTEYEPMGTVIVLSPVQEAYSPTVSERAMARGATSWYNERDNDFPDERNI